MTLPLRWRQVEKLLTRADGIAPLGDPDEELLTTARIAISAIRLSGQRGLNRREAEIRRRRLWSAAWRMR